MASKQSKHKPGIHLYKTHYWFPLNKKNRSIESKPGWFWHIIGKNGQIIAGSHHTYTRKGNAVKSIKVAANLFYTQISSTSRPAYYDHSKPDSPLQSYL